MPPNTVHFVLSAQKSLLTGSNLFLTENWFDSLMNILLTHIYGQTISNSAHPGMHIYAFHQVEFYVNLVESYCMQGIIEFWLLKSLDTEQICWPDAQLSSLDLVKLEELLALGKLPSQPSLCALILITIHSHKLTPQLDDQDPTYWPAWYMADRHLAQTAAKMLLKLVVHDQKIKETYEEMAQDLDAILSEIPFDRHQQDLLDPSESNVGFQHQ